MDDSVLLHTRRIDDLGEVCAVGISPDNRRIVVASKGTIVFLNAQTGKLLHDSTHSTPSADGCPIHAASFSPDGVYVVLGAADRTACVIDSRTGEQVHDLSGLHTDSILDASFSGDGARVVLASADGTASVHDAKSGRLLKHIKGVHDKAIHAASFSPDGSWLVLGSADGTASVVDASTGKVLHKYFNDVVSSHRSPILAAAFAPSGKDVVLGSHEGKAFLMSCGERTQGQTAAWGAHRGEVWKKENLRGAVNAVHFTPISPEIVFACEGREAVVLHAETGELMHTLTGSHKDRVFSACFTSDASAVVLGSADAVSITQLWVRAPPRDVRWGQHHG